MNGSTKYVLTIVLSLFYLILTGQDIQHVTDSKAKTRILFIFDASKSMADFWQSDTKFHIAVNLFSAILDSLSGQPDLELALRVYGHMNTKGPSCEDSRLEVPFGSDNIQTIKSVLKVLSPRGTTPIAYSLDQAVHDFTPCESCRNVVVLITDGLEACGGDPCKISLDFQRMGIFLRPFVVGIGQNMQAQYNCMGNYFDASIEQDFDRALQTIVTTTLKPATAQINLLDHTGNPTITDVNIILYDHVSGIAMNHFVHTLNEQGNPDTLWIDPLITYDIVALTIPSIRKDSVWLNPGVHTVIDISAPQGFLEFSTPSGQLHDCIIRKEGSGEAINVQSTHESEKYLAGRYDITILTLPRMNYRGVEISPGRITKLTVPKSGIAFLEHTEPVAGSLFMEQGGEFFWVKNLDTELDQLELQPGNYRIVYRKESSKRSANTLQTQFVIKPGETIHIPMD